MAPEQAAGGKVDARSDIFSFGTMLYEMATGTKAFAGTSVADTLAAVLRAQPTPPMQIIKALPRELERLILRCLKKEPERRYQLMLDVRNELQEIKEESDSGALAAPAPPAGRRRTLANRLAFVRTVNTLGVYTLEPAPRPVLVSSFWDIQPQFSPDGQKLVFTSSRSGESLDI
jgi:serine/threonine protein kinase